MAFLALLFQSVGVAGEVAIGASFVFTGSRKLLDVDGAHIAVLDYRLVPPRFGRRIAMTLATLETASGVGLILLIPIAPIFAIVLLAVFSFAIFSALARKLNISCHCFNSEERISSKHLARNALLAVLLAISFHPDVTVGTPLEPQLFSTSLSRLLAAGFVVVATMAIMAVIRQSGSLRAG